MTRHADKDRKKQILDVAEALFAAKGFHGTRVDEIAKQANVNKATIYYYFSSKQAILDYLIEEFLNSFVNTSKSLLSSSSFTDTFKNAIHAEGDTIEIMGEQGFRDLGAFLDEWLEQLLDFFEAKQNILRIIVSESVLDGGNRDVLFKLSDLIAAGKQVFPEQFEALGIEKLNDATMVMKFFGGILPIVYYAICKDSWSKHYSVSKETLKQGMLSLFRIELMGYSKLFER
ncbi:TetR/AcrR family transcriptional regulator [Christensenellaceae bacterium OttesenSCG-928-M15]|nr:TetR/AcrR family transcriptional regulator [Christensenellaceae bacterium OttesenSCG-928-M15]